MNVTRTGPSINRSRSKQDYGTPADFIEAVERRFGLLSFDLACTTVNSKAMMGFHFDEGVDALTKDWSELDGNLWLNPPFDAIYPWAKKLHIECQRRQGFAFFLTPASVGTEWFSQHVNGYAHVLGLSPRLTFEGCDDPYPKDLMLSVYGYGLHGFDTWRWR